MSIVVIVALTVVVAYCLAVAVQYEVHRSVARRLRPVPVRSDRPTLRLVADRTGPSGVVRPLAPRPTSTEVDLPPSAA